MLHFQFHFQKTLQASALILRLHGRKVAYLRLLKELYIADRELLAEIGSPLTGDRAYAMKQGPVLSTVYNIIKMESTDSAEWEKFIRKSGYEVVLENDPGVGKLSKIEVAKLKEVSQRYWECNDFDLVAVTHEFKEWKKAFLGKDEKSSYPISWEDVLIAQDKKNMIEIVQEEEAERRAIQTAFGK